MNFRQTIAEVLSEGRVDTIYMTFRKGIKPNGKMFQKLVKKYKETKEIVHTNIHDAEAEIAFSGGVIWEVSPIDGKFVTRAVEGKEGVINRFPASKLVDANFRKGKEIPEAEGY